MSAAQIAQLLLSREAVKVRPTEPFTWTSGIHSPIYCDNRLLVTRPTDRASVIEGFKQLIEREKIEFDTIGGTATAAIPWGAFLAHELGKEFVYIRPKPKEHGAGKQVEGAPTRGSRTLIVEDLISTGGSSIKSAEACVREYDAAIVGVIAIFTYGFPSAVQAFAEAKIPFWTLTDFPTLVAALQISPEQKAAVLGFAADPASWWDRQSGETK